MKTQYAGGFEAGDTVQVLNVIGAHIPPNLAGKQGVVAFMDDKILAQIQPGEVPVRIAQVLATRLRDEEVFTFLLPTAWIEKVTGVTNATTTHRASS